MNDNPNLSKDTNNILNQALTNADNNNDNINNNYIEKIFPSTFFPLYFQNTYYYNLYSQNKDMNRCPNIYDNPNNKSKNIKPENLIDISKILSGKEKRTFVRLHPIPKKYSVYDMVRTVDKTLKTEPGKRIYNAVYLPMTKIIGRNIAVT